MRSVVTAQEQLVAILDDDTTAVSTEGGFLVLDLRPLMIQLGDQVAILGNAAQRFPEDAGRIKIMEADQLETAQDLTQLLRRVAMFLPFVVLALWGIALWLARGRRRAVLRTIGIGLIAVGLLVLVVRASAVATSSTSSLAPTRSGRLRRARGTSSPGSSPTAAGRCSAWG